MGMIVSVISLLFMSTFANQSLPSKAPAPTDNPTTKEKVTLGKILFFDKRLSKDNSVSCNECHNVNRAGVDALPTSKGIAGQFGGRNSPTVYNAAFLSVQFWDGRAASLEEQAKGPLINPKEMGMENHDAVVAKVKAISGYAPLFDKAFGKNSINIDNIAKAIAAFERTLITPNSPFDHYIRGNKKALTVEQERGWQLFQANGCITCHQGATFAGPVLPVGVGFYQKFPLMPDRKFTSKYKLDEDPGRFEATKQESDKGMFRVPSLRNVALTGPYFHNGKVQDLHEAVRIMGKVQRGVDLKDEDVNAIVAFLGSLSGKMPIINEPDMPK